MSADNPPLTGVLAGIEEIAGREAAVRLAETRGGQSIHVPRPEHLSDGHLLASAVGLRLARAIAARYSGEVIYVPMDRRAVVRHLAAMGLPTADIAARLRLSHSVVRRYRRR